MFLKGEPEMRRFIVLLIITFATCSLFAAGSPELLVAIRNGDYSAVQ